MVKKKRAGASATTVFMVLGLLSVAVVSSVYLFRTGTLRVPSVPNQGVITSSQVDVLIPIQNIELGVELKAAMFRKESREARALVEVSPITSFDQLRGVYAKSFIPQGQPLVADQLTSTVPINMVVPQIRSGYRAITLKLDKQTTNEGWARAGVRVDVVLVTKPDTSQQAGRYAQSERTDALGAAAAIIVQNVRVLSSGTSVSSEFGGEQKVVEDGESTVTLEVSVEDQKRLKLASGQGELRLLLRGDEDGDEVSERNPIPLANIISLSSETPSAGPPSQGWVSVDGKRYRVVGASLVPE